MIIDWEHHFIAEEIYQRRGIKAGQPMMKDGKVAGQVTGQTPNMNSIKCSMEHNAHTL